VTLAKRQENERQEDGADSSFHSVRRIPQMKSTQAAIIGAGCGLPIGILMIVPLGFHFGWTNAAESTWCICNYPALRLADGFAFLWGSLGLGPHGDQAWDVLLVSMGVAILIQWSLIGAIVGLLAASGHSKYSAEP
jgi:hypothetical protein